MKLTTWDWEKEIKTRNVLQKYYTENELLSILNILVKSFSILQKNNVTHRDIKPQNILVCKGINGNPILKIGDFREAKRTLNQNNNKDTISRIIGGTELYMSPVLFYSLRNVKCLRTTKHNTYKSDVFSLGYYMIYAASLSFKLLYIIREMNNMTGIKKMIKNYIGKKYSESFMELIYPMLEMDEKLRPDFVELEGNIKKYMEFKGI